MDLGPVVIIVVLVVGVVVFLLGLVPIAAAIGWAATRHAESTHEGSELIDLNR